MRLSLHFLPAFVAVAKSGNLRTAALQLHLTHSAVSQQIRQLEQEIGAPLFDRPGRTIALNQAGAALLAQIEPALAQIQLGARDAVETLRNPVQLLKISVLPSFAQRWLLPRMNDWRAKYPHYVIELHASQQVMDLSHGEFHAAIRQGDGKWPGLQAQALFDSPWVAVGCARAAARLNNRPLEKWLDEAILGSPQRWQHWFASQGVKCTPRPVATFNDAGLMLQAAEQDMGIALTRELFVADALVSGSLQLLSRARLDIPQERSFWLVHRPQLAGSPALEAFRGWIASQLEQAQAKLKQNIA
jgi:LysR family transcriptional regulator, glycine cleavage system transcriptional activator